jgi:hypothetical protein
MNYYYYYYYYCYRRRIFTEQLIITKLTKKMLLKILKLHYGLHKSPLLLHIMSQMNLIHTVFLLKAKLSLYLTTQALRHEEVWGSGCIDQRILDLGTNWR